MRDQVLGEILVEKYIEQLVEDIEGLKKNFLTPGWSQVGSPLQVKPTEIKGDVGGGNNLVQSLHESSQSWNFYNAGKTLAKSGPVEAPPAEDTADEGLVERVVDAVTN